MVAYSCLVDRRRSDRRRARRARTRLRQHLGWLTGFPLDPEPARPQWLVWSERQAPTVIDLTPDQLRAARSTLASLQRLARLQPELMRWVHPSPQHLLAGAALVIDLAEAWVERGECPPADMVDRLDLPSKVRRQAQALIDDPNHPGLTPLVAEASWIYLTDPQGFRPAVRALADNAEILGRLGPTDRPLARRLATLAVRTGQPLPASLGFLVRHRHEPALPNPAWALREVGARLRRRQKGSKKDSAYRGRPLTTLYRELLHHCDDLVARADDDLVARLALPDLLPVETLADLDTQRRLIELFDRADVLLATRATVRGALRKAIRGELYGLADQIDELARTEQPGLLSAWSLIRRMHRTWTPDLDRAVHTLLTDRPPAVASSVAYHLVRHWSKLGRAERKRWLPTLAGQRMALEAGVTGWLRVFDHPSRWFDHQLWDLELDQQVTALRAFSLLDERKVTFGLDGSVYQLVRHGVDSPDDVVTLSQQLTSAWPRCHELVLALVARGAAIADIETLVGAGGTTSAIDHPVTRPACDELLDRWSKAGLDAASIVGAGLADRVVDQLSLQAKLVLLRAAADGQLSPGPVPEPGPGTPTGLQRLQAGERIVDRYPARFRPTLRRLVQAGIDPGPTAATVLGKTYPEPGALAHQIAAIDRRIAEGGPDHLRVRRRRLLDRSDPDDRTLNRLDRKLDRAVTARLFHAIGRELATELDRCLQDRIGQSGAVDQQSVLPVLVGAAGLDGRYQQAVIDIGKAHLDGGRYDRLSEPANVSFVAEAKRAGVDLEPWLRPTLTRSAGGLRVEIETDPFEVLQMGVPFGTCLSTSGVYFFSAVVNAVEVNKALVVGRDRRGRMAARCLLALDRSLAIVSYRPYAHRDADRFGAAVADLVTELASLMGTVTAPAGTIPRLIFDDWLDDGSHDLTGQLDFLADDSPFMTKLPLMKPAELRRVLAEIGCPLTSYLVSLIQTEAMQRRPDLFRVVVEPLDDHALRLMFGQVEAVIRAAIDHGELDWARQQARLRLLPQTQSWDVTTVAPILVDLDPSNALRVIRRHRPRQVRADDQEIDPRRLRWLADAHSLLGRADRSGRLRARAAEIQARDGGPGGGTQ